MEHEIFSELVLFSQLSPFDASTALSTGVSPLLTSLESTHRLLTVEESALSLGWGAEIAARAAERSNDSSRYTIRRAAAMDLPIANSKALEDAILPSVDDIVSAALDLCRPEG
jgi:pyruvate dehydrogenase E1 component beta subunit